LSTLKYKEFIKHVLIAYIEGTRNQKGGVILHNRTRVRDEIIHFGIRGKDEKSRFAKYIKSRKSPETCRTYVRGVTLHFGVRDKVEKSQFAKYIKVENPHYIL